MKLKNKPKIRLPTWKRYLYSFVARYKIFRRINQGIYKDLFTLKRGEIFIIKNTLIKFGNGGIWERENKFNILNFYLNFVEKNFNRVSLKDVRLAHKISPLRKIKGETLMSEMLTLKKFAKEVGLGFADTKGLNEEELVVKICEAIDEKGKYSKEFKKWYEDVDKKYPALFANSKGSDDEVDIDQLVDAVETADEMKDLKELFDFEPFASEKEALNKIKDMSELQEAMMEMLTSASSDDEKKETKKKDTTEIDPEVVEAIKASEDVDELKGICQDDDYKEFFKDISMRGKQKVENLKAKMLEALGITEEEGSVSTEELEAELNEMSDKDLKAKAEEFDIKPPALMTKKKKEELIQKILEKASEGGGEETKDEEITPSLIKKAVLAKDIDTLLGMAEVLEYKPKFTEKKNPKALGDKLIELVSEKEEEAPKKNKEKGKDKVESIYSAVERLTKEGKKSFAIVKEVTPLFEKLGQDDKDFIKEKVKSLMEIVEMEA